MPFAPQHDYDSYDAAIAKHSQTRQLPSLEDNFRRYADYYVTLLQARRQLGRSSEDRMVRKKEKIELHTQLVKIYNTMDKSRGG